ncbi:MAG: GNAT family N-acetyltransferase [Chloroflexota bacterium]|nr:MAG: GNAT family N-acetyltransferase [Chloroflexota bacterium]
MDAIFDFSYFPVLETERLRLRQITHADADAIIGIFGSPDVLRYLDSQPILTTEAAIEMIDWLNGHFRDHQAMRWGITLKGQDAVIGTCGFHFWKPAYRRVDIGYDLQPPYWGQGYITEACRCLVRWCFENLNLHRVQADCTAGNIGSERVLEKLGFTLEGTWRESCFEHGRFVDIKQYGLLRREYLPDE